MWLLLPFAVLLSAAVAAPISGPNLVGDSPQARTLFYFTDTDHDDLLTRAEFHKVFVAFDANGDTHVTLTEFLNEWKAQAYGEDTQGIRLFLNLDVNKDSLITEAEDMPYIFYFFDRNGDEHVTEGEFVTQWVKIST